MMCLTEFDTSATMIRMQQGGRWEFCACEARQTPARAMATSSSSLTYRREHQPRLFVDTLPHPLHFSPPYRSLLR